MQSVAFFSLDRHVKNMHQELTKALQDVLESQQFVGGKFVEGLEKAMQQYLNSNHVISCNSGTDALWLALKALNIQKNDIVLTTPFSFIASSSEIVAHEAHPVFIDIDRETFNICPVALKTWLTEHAEIKQGVTVEKKTGKPVVGMIVVDIFGQCAHYAEIKEIAAQWNLWIIEDTAQALGASYNNQQAGTLGTIGCFSFYPTKNLGAFGDAGCCCTNDPVLAETLLRLRNHGRKTHYDYVETGINSRLDGMQAALLTVKLPHLDTWNTRRAEIAERYNKAFAQHPLIKIPRPAIGKHVYHQYSLQLATPELRNELEAYLTAQGIGTRVFYPKSLQDIDFLNTDAKLATSCPIARNLTQTVLALPVWPELTDAEVACVIDAVLNAPMLQTPLHTMPTNQVAR